MDLDTMGLWPWITTVLDTMAARGVCRWLVSPVRSAPVRGVCRWWESQLSHRSPLLPFRVSLQGVGRKYPVSLTADPCLVDAAWYVVTSHTWASLVGPPLTSRRQGVRSAWLKTQVP